MQFPRSKRFNIVAIILLSLILLAFALLYIKTQSYLNENISNYISNKSKGKYELTFDNLKINFINLGFELNNVAFHPTDSIIKSISNLNSSNQLFSFSSPKIRFSQIHLLKLIFNQQLEIGEISITTPTLKIHGKPSGADDKRKNIQSVLLELKPLVTKSFKYIKVKKVELVNATFDFYNLLDDTHKLANGENITLGIINFYTDSLLLPNPEKLFTADDIYLRMFNYQNKLGDSIHTLNAKIITYSLKKAQIEADNIELKPISQSASMHSKYQVLIPKAIIKSSDIRQFYKNKIIPIDSVVLTDAKIKYWPGLTKTQVTLDKIMDFELYPLIENEFTSIRIANFKLNNAQLTLYKNQTANVSEQELKNIHINLEDFLLDSVSSQDSSRIFYSKNIDFSASGYKLTLGDNIHRIKAEVLNLSTKRKSVFIKNIEIFPLLVDQAKMNITNTIHAKCDSIMFYSFDIKRAYHTKRFYLQSINLFNPVVNVTRNEISDNKKEPENSSFVYNLISNYLKGIYADQVSIQKGKFQLINKTGVLQKGHVETSFKLLLGGFALDEISAKSSEKLFFADQIELNFSDYEMQLVDQIHKLTIENFSLSTLQKQASVKNLHLFPTSKDNIEKRLKQYNRSELYEFTIPELSFTNAFFHEAFFNKKFHAGLLTIKKPVIYYENFAFLKPSKPKADFEDLYYLISNYLDDINIDNVDIPDGTIQLINHDRKGKTISLDNHFSLGLEKLLINKDQFGRKKLLFSEEVEFSVRDHLIRLSDNVHVIKAGTIGFSTKRNEAYLTNAKMYPEPNSTNFSTINWNFQLSIPEIRIRGIDIEELYFDQKITADNVLISSPEIKLYQKNKNTKQTEFKGVIFPLPKEIETISIGQFNLNNASLMIFSELGEQPYLIVQSDLEMESQNILVTKNEDTNQTEFKRGKYTAGLYRFKFTPRDNNQQISVEELKFSTSERNIIAKQLIVKPKTLNNQIDQFEMHIPLLSMNGFDIDNAYRNYQYFFESIVVDKPALMVYNNTRDTSKINPFNINIFPHFKSFADVFATKSLKVNNAALTVFKNGQKTLQEKITFNLSNFRIDEKPSIGFLHAADFSFRIQNIKRQDARKLYQFTIDELEYSSKNDHFTARDLRVIPNLSKEKFNKLNGFQSDYFNGKLDSVVISQPNIQRWFDKGEIAGKEMSIIGLYLDIYRDKRVPFDEKRRPKMIQDIIKTLPNPVQFDSLKLVNAKIQYSEQPYLGDEEGKILFSNLNVCLKPFTNMKILNSKIPDFQLVGTATLMDSCQMKVKMNYQMNHPDNLFTASGYLSPFNMNILNPALEPLALVSIRSGLVNHFTFNLKADNTQATGQLIFAYEDLHISVLALKNGNTKEAKFASFIANSLLLRSKTPKGKELFPDEINFQRDPKHSILNYWWKSIFSGVRNTLGIKEIKVESSDHSGNKSN